MSVGTRVDRGLGGWSELDYGEDYQMPGFVVESGGAREKGGD